MVGARRRRRPRSRRTARLTVTQRALLVQCLNGAAVPANQRGRGRSATPVTLARDDAQPAAPGNGAGRRLRPRHRHRAASRPSPAIATRSKCAPTPPPSPTRVWPKGVLATGDPRPDDRADRERRPRVGRAALSPRPRDAASVRGVSCCADAAPLKRAPAGIPLVRRRLQSLLARARSHGAQARAASSRSTSVSRCATRARIAVGSDRSTPARLSRVIGWSLPPAASSDR